MNRALSAIVLSSLLGFGSSLAAAEDSAETSAPPSVHPLVIMSGVEGGGYWNAGTRLQEVAAEHMHMEVDNLPSSGSMENLEQLINPDSPVNLVFAQADAAQLYLNAHPADLIKVDLLENIGQECVFIVTGKDSPLHTDKDIFAGGTLRLGITGPQSGMAATLDYMRSQIPELDHVRVKYGDTYTAMEQMNSKDSPVDAIMMVHRPRELSPEIENALANPDSYRFVELSDERFTQVQWNGRKIYRAMRLALPGADQPVKTVCVLGLLLANKQKLSIAQRNQLGDLVNYHWMQVYATQ